MKKQLTMQKRNISILAMVTAMIATACVIPLTGHSTNIGDKENIIDLRIDIVTDEEAEEYCGALKKIQKQGGAKIEAGDYRVTVHISNNTGFGATGLSLTYGADKFEPRLYTKEGKEVPVVLQNKELFSVNMPVGYNEAENTVGWSTMSTESLTENGDIASFFFCPKEGTTADDVAELVKLSILQWDTGGKNIVHVNPIVRKDGFYFREMKKFADLDGDGDISQDDAVYTLQLATTLMNEDTTLNDLYFGDYYVFGTNRNQVCTLTGLADINGDGDVDIRDAQNLLVSYVENVTTGDAASKEVAVYQWIDN
jgi:hypothetical protein